MRVICEYLMGLILNVSCQHVFIYLNVLKIKKFKYACLRYITRLTLHVKRVHVYTYLTYMSTLITRINSTNFK
jgi:hypothetical protein